MVVTKFRKVKVGFQIGRCIQLVSRVLRTFYFLTWERLHRGSPYNNSLSCTNMFYLIFL